MHLKSIGLVKSTKSMSCVGADLWLLSINSNLFSLIKIMYTVPTSELVLLDLEII